MYLVFAGSSYYPCGGIEDLKCVKLSIDQAKEWYEEFAKDRAYLPDEWCQIVDHASMKVVWNGTVIDRGEILWVGDKEREHF